MALVRRGRYWWIDIHASGKRFRRSLRTDDKLKALDRYKEVKDALLSRENESRLKLADFIRDYLQWAWATKPASAYGEERKLKRIRAYFENECKIINLDDVTPYHIEQLKANLKNGGIAKSTINLYLRLLKMLFNRAIDWEIYDKPNPMKKVAFFKAHRQVEGLSQREIEKILSAAREVSANPNSKLQALIYDLIVFALNTGMRKSEVVNLKWKSVKEGSLIIRGKGDKVRAIPLNSTARAIIDKQPRRGEYVFDIQNRNGNNLLFWTVRKIGEATGVDWTFHQLRHAFVTRLLEKGVDFATISKLAGHSQLRTTFIYSHTDSEKMRKAVASLDTN